MAKIGEQFVEDMKDRGRRELGWVFFTDSNVAQQMYPLHGGKEFAAPTVDEHEKSILEEHLDRASQSRDDPGRDDRDQGIDRE